MRLPDHIQISGGNAAIVLSVGPVNGIFVLKYLVDALRHFFALSAIFMMVEIEVGAFVFMS